jgi:hypothetical protein
MEPFDVVTNYTCGRRRCHSIVRIPGCCVSTGGARHGDYGRRRCRSCQHSRPVGELRWCPRRRSCARGNS